MKFIRFYLIISVLVYLSQAHGKDRCATVRQSKNAKCYRESRPFFAKLSESFRGRIGKNKAVLSVSVDQPEQCPTDYSFLIRVILEKIFGKQNNIFEDAAKLWIKMYDRLMQAIKNAITSLLSSNAETETSGCTRKGSTKSFSSYFY